MNEYVPVLQFGKFSSTFKYNPMEIGYDDIIRIVAFISLPWTFADKPIYRFFIDTNRYLFVEADQLRDSVTFFQRLCRKKHVTSILRFEFKKILEWEVWKAISSSKASKEFLCLVMEQYYYLYQFIWFGVLMKEPIVKEYREELRHFFLNLAENEFEEFFLDTLIMPGSSYILQSHLIDRKYLSEEGGISIGKSYTHNVSNIDHRIKESISRYNMAMSKIIAHPDHDIAKIKSYLDLIATLTWFAEEKNLGGKDHQKTVKKLLSSCDVSLLNTILNLEKDHNFQTYQELILPFVRWFINNPKKCSKRFVEKIDQS